MRTLTLGLLSFAFGAGLSLAAQAEGSFDRSLSVSGPVELELETDSGGITVTTGRSGTVHVHAVLKGQHGWFDSSDVETRIRELERNPPIQQIGNHIRVGHTSNRNLLRNISMRLEIETPADTEVRARADSGGIRIRGVRGRVDSKTDSGGIEIEEVSSDLRAEADSGGIHIRDVKGAVFARVDSGGIDATDVSGSLDVEADSGHIRLRQTNPAPIRAKADSGGIRVTLAPGAGYDISASANSGGISVPEMTVRSAFSRRHIEGKIGGGGPLVSLHVDSGGITID
jgi:hypothetical protein